MRHRGPFPFGSGCPTRKMALLLRRDDSSPAGNSLSAKLQPFAESAMASQPGDVVIAVMGMTGVGKSSFIQRVTGRKDIRIGHSLSSGMSMRSVSRNILY
jgi:ABC-type transport system involved in cytochrome bd biosynthesis fused ATPase/permease subunit